MVAAVAAAAAFACRPEPGLGPVSYTRGAVVHVLDLATCRERVRRAPAAAPPAPLASADGRITVTVAARQSGAKGSQSIVVHDRRAATARTVYRVAESYARIPAGAPGPLMLFKLSGDARWIFFAIDPQGSQSLAADGLRMLVVSTRGGRVHRIGPTLAGDDYLSWCNGALVYTGGGDRIATTNKQLLVAKPPDWRPRPLVPGRGRAFGSVTCAPDRRSVVVQEQRDTGPNMNVRAQWSLWRVGLDGREARLTAPPRGSADESPRFGGSTLLFVRSLRGHGALYGLRHGRVVGPFASLGYGPAYYGHYSWPYAVRP